MSEQNENYIKPSWYHTGGIDVFAFLRANMTSEELQGYHKGSAIKYLIRAGKKANNPYEQDMLKAKVHVEELLKSEDNQ